MTFYCFLSIAYLLSFVEGLTPFRCKKKRSEISLLWKDWLPSHFCVHATIIPFSSKTSFLYSLLDYIWRMIQLNMLYTDLQPGQTCHSKVMHRKEVTHSDGSYEKKSRRRAWLTIWDKVKSHVTLIDWCTGREWPVNCMTVISAWWRSNMPFWRLSGRLNYYITRWRQEVS